MTVGKDLDGIDHRLIKMLSQDMLGGLEYNSVYLCNRLVRKGCIRAFDFKMGKA